jgi:hypothetical protein
VSERAKIGHVQSEWTEDFNLERAEKNLSAGVNLCNRRIGNVVH